MASSTASSSSASTTTVPNPNFSLIQGDWEAFSFRQIEREDWPKVMKHVRENFMIEDPTCQLLGYSNDFGDEVETLVRQMLGDGLSFLVEHKESKDVVAVRITSRSTPTSSFYTIPISSYSGKVLVRLLDIMKKMANLFEAYGVQEIADLFILSISQKYRTNEPLLTEMYRRSVSFLQAEGYKVIAGVFTSTEGRKTARKLGFEEVCRLDFKEFIDETGQLVFNPEELTGGEYHAAVLAKRV